MCRNTIKLRRFDFYKQENIVKVKRFISILYFKVNLVCKLVSTISKIYRLSYTSNFWKTVCKECIVSYAICKYTWTVFICDYKINFFSWIIRDNLHFKTDFIVWHCSYNFFNICCYFKRSFISGQRKVDVWS